MPIEVEDIEELEKQIDYANLRKFKYEELIGMGFVPISVSGDVYNVVILSKDNEQEIRELLNSRLTTDAGYEFTIIKDKQFKDLIGIIDEHMASDKEISEIATKAYNMGLDEVFTGEENVVDEIGRASCRERV